MTESNPSEQWAMWCWIALQEETDRDILTARYIRAVRALVAIHVDPMILDRLWHEAKPRRLELRAEFLSAFADWQQANPR